MSNPIGATSELLGNGAGGAGAEERVEDGIAGEAEQLYQPAGQLLREGGRMPVGKKVWRTIKRIQLARPDREEEQSSLLIPER